MRMARRNSEPPLPTCPLCGAARVEFLGREGLNDQLTMLRCSVCDRTWSELVSEGASDDESD